MKFIAPMLIVGTSLVFASCAPVLRMPTSALGGADAPKATQLRIYMSYKGVDPKWFSYLSSEARLPYRPKDKVLKLPSVTAMFGQHVGLEFVEEYRSDNSIPKGPTVQCGIIINIDSAVEGDTIRFSGTSVLRRPTNRISRGEATRFAAQENLIDVTLQDGMTKVVELDGGGQMMINATLIDATGRPIRKPGEQVVPPNGP